MVFLVVAELMFDVLLVAGIVTQVLLPCVKGTPMFPFFRRGPQVVERDVQYAQEELELAEKEQIVKKLRDRAGRFRKEEV